MKILEHICLRNLKLQHGPPSPICRGWKSNSCFKIIVLLKKFRFALGGVVQTNSFPIIFEPGRSHADQLFIKNDW